MLRCKAFPSGIPDAVLLGRNPHTEPIPGDGGFRFERDPSVTIPMNHEVASDD